MKSLHSSQERRKALRRFTWIASLSVVAVGALLTKTYAHDDDDLTVIPAGQDTLLPNTNTVPYRDGLVGPLHVMHAMSVHNTILFKTNEVLAGNATPKMLMFHRHSGYRADEVANPDIINFLIRTKDPITGRTAYEDTANQFNAAFRRTFNQLCYGGYTIIHDVSQSVPTRIKVDQTIENCQLWDTGHPDAYNIVFNNPKFSPSALNNSDAETNFLSFKGMGPSRGLFYDMYCPGFATLEDGRVIFPGGHDMNSQNGLYRIQVFNPDSETWTYRTPSCMRLLYGADPNDPYAEKFFQAQKDLGIPEEQIYLPIDPNGVSLNGKCDPHALGLDDYSPNYPRIRLMPEQGTVTHPFKQPGDMKYARWYPTVVALPGNKAYIFAGWDRDEFERQTNGAPSTTSTAIVSNYFRFNVQSNYNIPTNWLLSGNLSSGGNNAFLNTRIKQPVPEVYDGTTDTTYALENARLFHNDWYPNATLVQTGTGSNDWGVAVLDGELFEDVAEAGGEASGNSSRTFTKMWLVDVQGALNDPDRDKSNVREGKFLKYVSRSQNSHTPFSGNANFLELDTNGLPVYHRLYHVGGAHTNTGAQVADAEMIDFANLAKPRVPGQPALPMPKWQVLPGKLYQRAIQNYATPLPDGNMCILGGNGGTRGSAATSPDGLPHPLENWSLHLQMLYTTNSGRVSYTPIVWSNIVSFAAGTPTFTTNLGIITTNIPITTNWVVSTNIGVPTTFGIVPEGSVKMMAKTFIPRDEHGIIQLWPDGRVYLGGQNRNGIVRSGDPLAPSGDSDLGVNCGQFYSPPYLFNADGSPATRPVITSAPAVIDYGTTFDVGVDDASKIGSVCIIRSGSMSHSLCTDRRYVKLPFTTTGNTLKVMAPKLPGTAIGGYWMLFVVSSDGVPCVSKIVILGDKVLARK